MTPNPKPAKVGERIHLVKCWPAYFGAIVSGEKPFDVRLDDRGYQKGDVLHLREWSPVDGYVTTYGGRECLPEYHEVKLRITYVLSGGKFGIEAGYVVLGLTTLEAEDHE